jgi:nicotinamidase-related amidase
MTETLAIDAKSTALLAMDFQNFIVDSFGDEKAALLARAQKLLVAARKAGVLVIYVAVRFRPGYPEISPDNAMFSGIKAAGLLLEGEGGADIHAAVAPQAGDLVVIKRRVSAFAGSDLEILLRANGIKTLVLSGIATSGVVLSTLREAADADYRLLVARDCCADHDAEVHRVLLEKVFPKQAMVVDAAAVLAALNQ